VSDRVCELLREPLEEFGRFADLAKVLEARARLGEDPEAKSAALRDLAGLRYERLGDPKGALDATLALAMAAPIGDAIDVLGAARRLVAELEIIPEHIDELKAMAGAAHDPDRRGVLLVSAADALSQLQADDRAAAELLEPLA